MTKPAKSAHTTRGATMELTVANADYAAQHEATPAEVVQREMDARRAAEGRPVRQPRATGKKATTTKATTKQAAKKRTTTKAARTRATKTTPAKTAAAPVEGTE